MFNKFLLTAQGTVQHPFCVAISLLPCCNGLWFLECSCYIRKEADTLASLCIPEPPPAAGTVPRSSEAWKGGPELLALKTKHTPSLFSKRHPIIKGSFGPFLVILQLLFSGLLLTLPYLIVYLRSKNKECIS